MKATLGIIQGDFVAMLLKSLFYSGLDIIIKKGQFYDCLFYYFSCRRQERWSGRKAVAGRETTFAGRWRCCVTKIMTLFFVCAKS
jgi:hypothetical protein